MAELTAPAAGVALGILAQRQLVKDLKGLVDPRLAGISVLHHCDREAAVRKGQDALGLEGQIPLLSQEIVCDVQAAEAGHAPPLPANQDRVVVFPLVKGVVLRRVCPADGAAVVQPELLPISVGFRVTYGGDKSRPLAGF